MLDKFSCHICKEMRPDAQISVHSTPLIIDGQEIGQQNVRYCNDNPDCTEKAKTYSHHKPNS